jgi:CcmD family protein
MNHQHLELAYIATWVILIAYVVFLTMKVRGLKKEFEDLERGSNKK